MDIKGAFLAVCIWLIRCGEQQLVYALENIHHNKTASSDFVEDTLLTRIAFGSCMNLILPLLNIKFDHNYSGMFASSKWYKQPQVVWKQILEHQPDLWIWLGDAAYADTRVFPLVWKPSPLSLMAKYFKRQKEHPDYQAFLSSGIKVVGIWDDHDYGFNDGGKRFVNRLQSQDIYLDFIDEPADSLRRKREGLYVSYTFGQGDKAVKLILLDVRSFAVDGEECDFLGSQQWEWLTEQLNDSSVAFTIITSGIQILSNAPLIQNWGNCPQSYDRLIWLTRQHEKVFYLSGDVHFAELSCLNSVSTGFPIYELTSSGLWKACTINIVRLKAGLCKWLISHVIGNDLRIKTPVVERNFGFIEINWNSKPIEIKLQVIGEQNNIASEFTFNLDHIQKRLHAENCPAFDPKTDSTEVFIFWSIFSLLVLAILAVIFALLFCLYKFSLMVLRGLVGGYRPFEKSTNDLRIKEKNS